MVIGMVGCQDSETQEPQEPVDDRYVQLSFELDYLETNDGLSAKSIHNYITRGYTMTVVENQSLEVFVFDNVNLEDTFSFETNEDITISISHRGFEIDQMMTEAYYGVDEVYLNTSTVDEHSIDVALIQGYVYVNSEEGLESSCLVEINEKTAEFKTAYYLTSSDVLVTVTSGQMQIDRSSANSIGSGVTYYVHQDEDGNLFFM